MKRRTKGIMALIALILGAFCYVKSFLLAVSDEQKWYIFGLLMALSILCQLLSVKDDNKEDKS